MAFLDQFVERAIVLKVTGKSYRAWLAQQAAEPELQRKTRSNRPAVSARFFTCAEGQSVTHTLAPFHPPKWLTFPPLSTFFRDQTQRSNGRALPAGYCIPLQSNAVSGYRRALRLSQASAFRTAPAPGGLAGSDRQNFASDLGGEWDDVGDLRCAGALRQLQQSQCA
jgi:hypothetical protein